MAKNMDKTMNRRLVTTAGLALIAAVLFWQPTSAHVLITDDSGMVGAVLHVTPDDDPVAGEPSSLFYEIRDTTQRITAAKLRITDEVGTALDVPVSVAGNTVQAVHTFSGRGAYRLVLSTSSENGINRNFASAQRVSRGARGDAQDAPRHAWAEMLIIASLCGLALLAIISFNRRREIISYSRMKSR
jgi:hypothetical protein